MIRKHKNSCITIALFMLFVLAGFFNPGYSQDSGEKGEPLKVLFIGSSYFNYDDLPGLFWQLTVISGKSVLVNEYIPSGYYLSDHAVSSYTESVINSQQWDYVVLQGVGPVIAYPEYYTNHALLPALITLSNKISDNCSSTKIVYCMPWAYEDGMTWLGWPDTYEDMQVKIYSNTLDYSESIGYMVAPVGWAWYRVLQHLNYPLHYLHLSDWNHPSIKGSYLMSLVIYSTIFQESTQGFQYYAGIPYSEAEYFQDVASTTVLNNIALWNIPKLDTLLSVIITPGIIKLYQNYPNPFKSETRVEYEVARAGNIEILLYNETGTVQRTLIREYKTPGTYSLVLNESNLSPGIYYYAIRTTSDFYTRKLVIVK